MFQKSVFILLVLTMFVGFSPEIQATSIANFQLNGIAVLPDGGTTKVSGQLSWTPYLGAGGFGVRLDAGVGVLNNTAGTMFLTMHGEGLLSLPLLPKLSLEAGGGVHNWVDNGGFATAITGNLVLSTIGIGDRVFVGYSRLFMGNGAHLLRAGIGFTL